MQCLQRLHGGREPWVRHGGTLFALFRLRDKELLSGSEYARLAAAYQFLRNLEHRLQFDEDRQTHTLPDSIDELELLARKMPPVCRAASADAGDARNANWIEHLGSVREIYERVIHSQQAHVLHAPDTHAGGIRDDAADAATLPSVAGLPLAQS